jgi:hypothetical protein
VGSGITNAEKRLAAGRRAGITLPVAAVKSNSQPREPTHDNGRSGRDRALVLPRNVKLGQVRRTVGLLDPAGWKQLPEDGRAAVDALTLHVWWRARPTEHPAFEEDDRVPNRRLDAAAAAGGGGTQDGGEGRSGRDRSPPTNRFDRGHGEVKKPRVPPGRVAREKRRRKTEAVQTEGGRFGQQTLGRSYWWRVYRVPALSMVMQARVPAGAYAHVPDLPQHLASLSSLLRRQGLIPSGWRRTRPNPGSVQWVFLHAGPP